MNRRFWLGVAGLVLGCAAWLAAGYGVAATAQDAEPGPVPRPPSQPVDFQQDIHPILAQKCFECHAGDRRRGGFSMESREALLEGGETGPAIAPGNGAGSYLVQLVAGEVEGLRMPPKGEPLSDDEVALLRKWVDEGAEWNLGAAPSDDWKAPVAPRRPEVPDAAADNPIDKFLAPYYAEHGITPEELVDDAAFLRRVYLDVTGLLPPVEVLDAFVASEEPDKRPRVVREVLGDNHGYAQHWMTFWNDALRNDFQGTGYIDGGRKQISEWLYQALYSNLPYDQFAMQLINPTPESEGFIKGIIWRGSVAAPDRPPVQAALSVSQVFLGVNLKCAACHDSFIDEWKLADAYGFANVFSDEPLELVRCDVPTGQMADTRFLFPEVGGIDADRPRKGRLAQAARLVASEDNGRFTRTIVNRLWHRFFGYGLVEPVDEMARRPWHPDLLDWLATDLADHGYNLRHTMERILTSRAYQSLAVVRGEERIEDYVFRGPEVRRLSAEQFMDAMGTITGAWQENPSFTPYNLPEEEGSRVRAWRVVSDPLTRILGRPNREQVVTHRSSEFSTLQAVELTNGATFAGYLRRAAAALAAAEWDSPDAMLTAIYKRGLQREPTVDERAAAHALMGEAVTAEQVEDVLWAVAMTPEFQLILK